MKADPADELETHGATVPTETSDPFAVDLFAASRERSLPASVAFSANDAAAHADGSPSNRFPEQVGERARVSTPWNAALPRVSSLEARFSKSLGALPPTLASDAVEACRRVLAQLANAAAQDVSFEIVDLREVSFDDWLALRTGASVPSVYALVALEPDGACVLVETDVPFASLLTGRMLGDEASGVESLRAISATERAIVEFLCLTLVRRLNEASGEPLFRLAAVTGEPPDYLLKRLQSQADGRNTRGVVLTVRTRVESLAGLCRFIFDASTLDALDARRNPLLSGERRAGVASFGAKLGRYRALAETVALRLLVGETLVAVADLEALEEGDVVLVERPLAARRGDQFAGDARLRVGDGANVLLAGRLLSSGPDAIALELSDIFTEEAEMAEGERLSMQEEMGQAEAGTDNANVLDALLLTVSVELAARRLTLDELARLRPGQILELGCRATDPVELYAGGRRIASGELVDIEGQLGVRITRLLS